MTSSCRHSINSEMLLDWVTLTSCAGFTFTLLDQLRELFNQFSLFIVRLSTVKLSVYQSISCLHLSISYVSVFHQLDAKISISCVCVIRSVVNQSINHQLHAQFWISCLCISQSVGNIIRLVQYRHNWLRSLDGVTFQNWPNDNKNLLCKPTAAD